MKRVLIMGDSIVHGLFGTTPKVTGPLTAALADRGVQVRFEGYPGETPIDTWPTNSTGWIQRMQAQISAYDPDMVIIQSVLFPDPDNAARQQLYEAAMRTLLDIAQSRGAHVYLVNHHIAPGSFEGY
ncbi:MAG: SGNH/GDSL hydrolase family protein, partial [Microthrixaceae bacterium]